jgi:hypothetical protein
MNAKAETTVPVLSSIGIDIGEDVFHLVGFDTKRKMNRPGFVGGPNS